MVHLLLRAARMEQLAKTSHVNLMDYLVELLRSLLLLPQQRKLVMPRLLRRVEPMDLTAKHKHVYQVVHLAEPTP